MKVENLQNDDKILCAVSFTYHSRPVRLPEHNLVRRNLKRFIKIAF